SRITYKQQGTLYITCRQQVTGNCYSIHTPTTTHWNIHTETIFRQAKPVLQYAGSRRSTIITRNRLKQQYINTVLLPTQLFKQFLGSSLAHIRGAHCVRSDMPFFYTDCIIEYISFLLGKKSQFGSFYHILRNGHSHSLHADILNFPSCHYLDP